MPAPFSLASYDITVQNIVRNATPALLYEHGLRNEPGTAIVDSGALVAIPGEKTGRSPKDKRIVEHPGARPTSGGATSTSRSTSARSSSTASGRSTTSTPASSSTCVDGFAGWDPAYRIKVRVICARAYHALFMHNMLIRPTARGARDFGKPDYVIYNAGAVPRQPLHRAA